MKIKYFEDTDTALLELGADATARRRVLIPSLPGWIFLCRCSCIAGVAG